jgi:quercetin dioxygenase-like cupin family protein
MMTRYALRRFASSWASLRRSVFAAGVVALSCASVLSVQAEETGAFAIPACDTPAVEDEGAAAMPADPALRANLPPGMTLHVLADAATEAWPPFARGLVMTVRALTLDPGVTAATRQSQGPVLFYVESGSVSVSINGRPEVFEQGAAFLIERSKNYQLRNEDLGTPATLLRVQVVPPGSETKVSRGDIAQVVDDEQMMAPGPPFIRSQLLLTADVPAMDGPGRLVLGCLAWEVDPAGARDTVHPGPVALLVLDGELLVGNSGALGAGQCTVFQGDVVHRLGPGASPPRALLIGILPAEATLWEEPVAQAPAPLRLRYSCDPDVPPDAIPDGARRRAPLVAMAAL